MMATMVAELGMSTLPATCTGAVRRSQMTTKGACDKVKGLVVMASDGGELLVRKRESQTVKDIHGPAAVTTAIAPDGLAQIVEQAHDGNAVSGVIACMREHMLIHLKGVLGKASVLLVVAIAAALEVARGQEIVDNGFDAGALGRAEDLTDPVSGIRHVRHGFGILYSPAPKFLHRNLAKLRITIWRATPSREVLKRATWPNHESLYQR